jgi:hypothetical protein
MFGDLLSQLDHIGSQVYFLSNWIRVLEADLLHRRSALLVCAA